MENPDGSTNSIYAVEVYAVEVGGIVDGHLCGIGKRIYEVDDGRMEQGEFVNGYLHGSGKRTYYGIKEEGQYVGGRFVKGTITFPDKRVLRGDFVDGYLHGQGKRIFDDGHKEEGDFVHGELVQRNAKVTSPGGDVHDGNFVNGILCKGR